MLENIKPEELKEKLLNLEKGESIFIPVDKDDCNSINLLMYQLQSLDNLFMSYMNKTNEQANAESLNTFLNVYVNKFLEKEEFIKNSVTKIIGSELYRLILTSGIKYNIDTNLYVMKIFK